MLLRGRARGCEDTNYHLPRKTETSGPKKGLRDKNTAIRRVCVLKKQHGEESRRIPSSHRDIPFLYRLLSEMFNLQKARTAMCAASPVTWPVWINPTFSTVEKILCGIDQVE